MHASKRIAAIGPAYWAAQVLDRGDFIGSRVFYAPEWALAALPHASVAGLAAEPFIAHWLNPASQPHARAASRGAHASFSEKGSSARNCSGTPGRSARARAAMVRSECLHLA